MEPLFNVNGLMFWTEREIRLRRQFEDHFAFTVQQILLETNPAWRFIQIEAPLLTPWENINPNYTHEDIWAQESELDLWESRTAMCSESTEEELALAEAALTEGPPEGYNELALRPETTDHTYTLVIF